MKLALLAALALIVPPGALASATPARKIPQPLPDHPGNVFLEGEQVTMAAAESTVWRLFDYEGQTVASGEAPKGGIALGPLPVGYYELQRGGAESRVSLAVIQPLHAPTPEDSPISCDVALAWLLPPEKARAAANLCALAGLNWVRDRLNWGEMEPSRGNWAASNRYDLTARAQVGEGLQVLQVNHISPAWANPKAQRFPLDLRDAFNFYREAARRWKAEIAAFEPWNEADIKMFGGHTGSEMASFQKAAYLGLKAGNPHVIACLNVLAHHRGSTLADLHENQTWPYFDTYNLHHYEPFANYPRIYADHRAVSAGKPLWVTECALPVKWQDEKTKEPSTQDLRTQSERVAITYGLSLFEGAENVFYFVLPHYVEGQTQFGLIRPDLTPRPAYVALAAAGRLLAGAVAAGKLSHADPKLHACAFRVKPGLVPRSADDSALVLVAWADESSKLELPSPPLAIFDHLGRRQKVPGKIVAVGRAPAFIVLDQKTDLKLLPALLKPPLLRGETSDIVLQALMPEESVNLEKSAYQVHRGEESKLQLFAYNFGQQARQGTLNVHADTAWEADVPGELEIQAGERKPVMLSLRPGAAGDGKIRIEGNFGRGGTAVLSLRIIAQEP